MDFLIEVKKARTLLEKSRAEGKLVPPQCEIVAIGIVPQADELRACLQSMKATDVDEELIEHVRQELRWREEEGRRYLEYNNSFEEE